MKDVRFYINTGIIALVLAILWSIVEKKIILSKKILKIQYIIFMPILLILSVVKWIKTHQLLGEQNCYFLFFMINVFNILLFFLGKLSDKYFLPYLGLGNEYINQTKYKREWAILMSNVCIVFSGIAAIVFFINDFIVKLNL
ncbi:hypothetical protein [Clostridium sp. KNHs214]|uniref:hypothetical protein n=1 Tax=Clostridium sp. KNHs214 TaxID=1540257 RepID=UPI000558994F|nr:hypothetical protein [Clostridium sp. KNHs214]